MPTPPSFWTLLRARNLSISSRFGRSLLVLVFSWLGLLRLRIVRAGLYLLFHKFKPTFAIHPNVQAYGADFRLLPRGFVSHFSRLAARTDTYSAMGPLL
jgi:hypothetical protein